MKQILLTSGSAAQTKRIGKVLGRSLRPGDVLALQGPLGSGKTTMVKGLAKGLGVRSDKAVSSPTFMLIHEYAGRWKIFHLDWYRLRALTGVDAELARECFESPGVTLVEWPERGKKILPARTLRVRIAHAGEHVRRLRLSFPKTVKGSLQKELKRA